MVRDATLSQPMRRARHARNACLHRGLFRCKGMCSAERLHLIHLLTRVNATSGSMLTAPSMTRPMKMLKHAARLPLSLYAAREHACRWTRTAMMVVPKQLMGARLH